MLLWFPSKSNGKFGAKFETKLEQNSIFRVHSFIFDRAPVLLLLLFVSIGCMFSFIAKWLNVYHMLPLNFMSHTVEKSTDFLSCVCVHMLIAKECDQTTSCNRHDTCRRHHCRCCNNRGEKSGFRSQRLLVFYFFSRNSMLSVYTKHTHRP